MNDINPLNTLPTEKLRLILKPTGPIAPEAGPELEAILQTGIPTKEPTPQNLTRKPEFPHPAVEEALERIRKLAAKNPQREAALRKKPPSPNAKSFLLAELEASIIADVQALHHLGFTVRVELNPTTHALTPEPAEAALTSSPLGQLRRLVVMADDNQVVISGQVSSYYLKQVAAETVRSTLGRRTLLNNVEVSPESS